MGEPAVDLALVESVRATEALQSSGLPIHLAEPGDCIDQLVGEPGARAEVGIERCWPATSIHARPAVDKFHQIEAGSEHARVVTSGDRARVRHAAVLERSQDAVFAQHRFVTSLRYL